MLDPRLLELRRVNDNRAALVFVHGFGGSADRTWGRFPEFLASDRALNGWDIFSLGYPTTFLLPDIAGLFSAEPDLRTVADELATRAVLAPLKRYKALTLVAHSMGGLVVQRALVDRPELAERVSHVILFGTPSFGLAKARPVRFWKRQTANMVIGSQFLTDLRTRWSAQFGRGDSFKFLAVAGAKDEFVPRASSLDGIPPPGFPLNQQMVVPGNHLDIIKPESPGHLSLRVVAEFLTSGTAVYDSAAAAAERARFQAAVNRLRPGVGRLDDNALVELALALEALGDTDAAIEALLAQPDRGTDPTGVLAGRFKRRWLQSGNKGDGAEALHWYTSGLAQASAAGDHEQTYYLAINVAFMEWAFNKDRTAARAMAETALDACARTPPGKWRFATEGEAALILGRGRDAVESYRQALSPALAKPASPREIDSMYQQAAFELDLDEVPDRALVEELRQLFLGESAAV